MRFVAVFLACLFAARAEDMGVQRNLSEIIFAPIPGMPACMTGAVESGDPAKGASLMIFEAAANCEVPWHWHTPTEQEMIVRGLAKVEMKGGAATTLGPGGFALMPSKHVHQFTCTTACIGFVHSGAALDIHYVDAVGKEIPPVKALAKGK